MSIGVRYDSMTHLLAFTSIYELAQKYNLTSYDAAYLELAIRLGAPLATNDQDLINAAGQAGISLF